MGRHFGFACVVIGLVGPGWAAGQSYVPLGGALSDSSTRLYVPLADLGGAAGAAKPALRPVKIGDRPVLRGARPVEVELLEDALRRKQPRTVGDSIDRAHETIIRYALRDQRKRSHLRGIYAEARFLHENTEWGYVRSPTAPQVDVYRWQSGTGRPLGAQIKTHIDADPVVYARDMRADHKADLFLVPDEHADGLRKYWQEQIIDMDKRGRSAEGEEARRQLKRIRGIGFNNQQLDDDIARAALYCSREKARTYVALGGRKGLIVSARNTELLRGGQFVLRSRAPVVALAATGHSARAKAIPGKQVSAAVNRQWLRGAAGMGVLLFGFDTAWSIYDNGGYAAFQNPRFCTRLGGSMGSLAGVVGVPVGLQVTTAMTPVAGGWAPAVGTAAGLLTGAFVGFLGYVGGESTARVLLEIANPEFLRQNEEVAIEVARRTVAEMDR